MKIIRNEEGETHHGHTFTGHAELLRKLAAQKAGGIAVSIVRFENGALTFWHDHPGEQVLLILEGVGRVGDGTDEFTVEAGDIVYTGPGERHWHGAAPGKDMTHVSITTEGPPEWYEPVE